ncbi:MAG: hypothetical protein KKF68_00675 [Nanoarchaeota archaeon]|nr:hypothetical protein [Nanoarchaeota archaeon]
MPKKKKESNVLKNVGKGLWFLAKTPYYATKGLYSLGKYTDKKIKKSRVNKKKKSMIPVYVPLDLLLVEKGDYNKWEKEIGLSDSKIGVILGARGTGKTAFGIKFLENIHAKHKKKCYAIGFDEEEMPYWIKVVKDINELGNNSFVLIDEGGILFSSRKAMSSANKLLSDLILIARHKNLSILFISQNSSNLDINILRQADFLVLKPSSLLQREFERKIIKNIYDNTKESFEKFKDVKGVAHIYSNLFQGFVSNPLPSFWGEKISKSFR